ncbi:competence protein CoiA [Bacillus mycoides]|uniref:competence protein CoiA n=1 Tax=Bacillus mycoides TaxID=1405 RepID=UPI000993D01D
MLRRHYLIGKVNSLLRCITNEKETLYASNCEEKSIRQLSREKKLQCPNCHNNVIYKKGKVMSAHFAHKSSECVVTNYEPETTSHIKGKEILFNWLNEKYPSAEVQYEVYIPETKQIADILVVHKEEELEGVRWAFEFQHSPLLSTDWEKRHNLYETAGIQDFWILDRAKFMKFSQAQDITDARLRKDLETTIYNKTGLCYFLDLSTSELTIDFEFTTSYETRIIRRREIKTPYIYHNPIQHSTHINQVRVRINQEFQYGVLIYKDIEKRMNDRLLLILHKLRKKQSEKLKQELKEKALEKVAFAKSEYGEKEAKIALKFMRENKENIADDIRNMQEYEFFQKYYKYIQQLQDNLKEFKDIEDSEDLVKKLIRKISSSSDFYELPFLIEQESQSLEEYLIYKNKEKVILVEYVYDKYKAVLEKIASMNPKFVNRELGKIKSTLTSWGNKPSALDYALEYRWLKSNEEIDKYIEEIKKKIINRNPFDGILK